jgi:hypothetical protein|tara:strand:- start:3325 stop:3441 length:117 start_codon:yes stop_codon:yes gene_type:complete
MPKVAKLVGLAKLFIRMAPKLLVSKQGLGRKPETMYGD